MEVPVDGEMVGFLDGPREGLMDGPREGGMDGLLDGETAGFLDGLPVVPNIADGAILWRYEVTTEDGVELVLMAETGVAF